MALTASPIFQEDFMGLIDPRPSRPGRSTRARRHVKTGLGKLSLRPCHVEGRGHQRHAQPQGQNKQRQDFVEPDHGKRAILKFTAMWSKDPALGYAKIAASRLLIVKRQGGSVTKAH